MKKIKKKRPNRRPSHPGEILKNVWLEDLGHTQIEFATILSNLTSGEVRESTMRTKLSELINGRRSMSAEFAVLLSRALGTAPRMWMNLQTNLDIWEVEEKMAS